MANELHPTLIQESKKTLNEAIEKLEKQGKVFVCRPTGFGKTYMLIQVAKIYREKYPDKRIAYIYPLDIIPAEIMVKYGKKNEDKQVREVVNKGIDFISYSTLTRKFTKNGVDYWRDIFNNDYSIILLDEVHAAGSEGFRNIYDGMKEIITPDNVHLLGVTATPTRMDDTDGNSVLESIFDNIQVYSYNLSNCIADGIIRKPVIGTRRYDIKDFEDQLKEVCRNNCKKVGKEFDEKSYNIELSKVKADTDDEPEIIYKYLAAAGYNLAESENKYLKFIVFFNNISDVANRGAEVEEWFDKAFNDVAKKDLKLKRDFLIRSHYLTSMDTEDMEIDKLIKQKPNRYKYNSTKKLTSQNLKDKYVVDLILTVNMTNMGYHDDDITGIMMLRGTKSEIIYYQQLGRAISVTSKYSPLIYDFVSNVNAKFWTKKNSQERNSSIAKSVLGDIGAENGGDSFDYSNLIARVEGDYDACEDFLNRWSDVYYSEKAKMIYLYEDRKAPIVAISADTGVACEKIAKTLLSSGIQLRSEDSMYNFENKILNSTTRTDSEKKNAGFILKHLYSKKASEQYMLNRKGNTLYQIINKLLGGRK